MTRSTDAQNRLAVRQLDLGQPAIAHLRNAVIVPPPATNRPARLADSGVLLADGTMVPESISWTTSSERVNGQPDLPATAKPLPGRYVFGGVFYAHFGHFLTESLARIWALDELDAGVDAMIFTPKVPLLSDHAVTRLHGLAQLLGVRVPFVLAREPVQVEELFVPTQGVGVNDLIQGSAPFRQFINRHAGATVQPSGGEKLYISRSRLRRDCGSILGEYKLEDYLAAEGYEIFHPQTAAAAEQIARYKAARWIVAPDSSPVHLLGFVGHADQHAAIILRRSMDVAANLARQLRAFKAITAVVLDCLIEEWIPMPGHRPSRSSWAEIDFGRLHAGLLASGHIRGTTPWPSLTPAELAAELARVEAMHETTFVALQELRARRATPG